MCFIYVKALLRILYLPEIWLLWSTLVGAMSSVPRCEEGRLDFGMEMAGAMLGPE